MCFQVMVWAVYYLCFIPAILHEPSPLGYDVPLWVGLFWIVMYSQCCRVSMGDTRPPPAKEMLPLRNTNWSLFKWAATDPRKTPVDAVKWLQVSLTLSVLLGPQCLHQHNLLGTQVHRIITTDNLNLAVTFHFLTAVACFK
jgi:hypothetical protein